MIKSNNYIWICLHIKKVTLLSCLPFSSFRSFDGFCLIGILCLWSLIAVGRLGICSFLAFCSFGIRVVGWAFAKAVKFISFEWISSLIWTLFIFLAFLSLTSFLPSGPSALPRIVLSSTIFRDFWGSSIELGIIFASAQLRHLFWSFSPFVLWDSGSTPEEWLLWKTVPHYWQSTVIFAVSSLPILLCS